MAKYGMKPTPAIDRLLARVEQVPGQCWLWPGATNSRGYGVIGCSIPRRRMRYVHRVSYEHFHGPIPEGMEILHSCDTRNCVNPEHLSVGTHAENVAEQVERDRVRKGRDMYWSVKLTEQDVRDIRAMKRPGVSNRKIAEMYGVSTSQIEFIIARKRWKHVA